MLIWILSPLVVSFLLRAFGGDGWDDLGIRPHLKGNLRWYALSILVYPLCALLVALLGLAFGTAEAPGFSAASLGLMTALFLQAFVPQFMQNVCEETGFRGYMAPKLFSLGWNVLLAHVLVGLAWGAWHLPYLRVLLAPVTPYAAEPMVSLVPRFLFGAVAASLVFGEIRIRTGSLWPAVLMQTIGGAFIAALLLGSGVDFAAGTAFMFMPMVEGVLMGLLFMSLGLALYRRRRKA
jgi:membrane protease YdiL (CAAX protease family)